MLATSTLLNQLTTKQQLIIASAIKAKVAHNSATLHLFQSMLSGNSENQISNSYNLCPNDYAKKERPIFQVILDFYKLKPSSSRDQVLSDVYYAIHEEAYESNAKKAKRLEGLFHQMKRYEMEQESAPLLNALMQASEGTPLHTVYEHLYNKYCNMEANNLIAYATFEKLNTKVSDFIGNNSKGHSVRNLISEFKKIRAIHRKNENRVSECIVNTSMLMLAIHCEQSQLLRESKWTVSELFETCKSQIENLPFGVERMFFKNIFDMTLKHALKQDTFTVNTLAFQRLKLDDNNTKMHNFGFCVEEKCETKRISKSEQLINNFLHGINTTAAISIKQSPMLSSPNRI